MTFLNAILLAGAAAFLIPLLIHLLNKRRVTTVAWGAMFLLHEALRQRKRNLKVEQWLLLLTRIAIPIVLAFCLARPVLSVLRQLPGLNKSSLLVVLDNSYSMRAPGEGGTGRERARADLRRILEGLPRGSDANVVLAGSPARVLMPQPTTALDLLSQQLEGEPSLAGPLALNDTFQLVQSELKRMGSAAREVLLISDFQQNDWRSLAEGGSLAALDTLKQAQPAPLLTFYHLPSELHENLTLASVEPSAFVVAKEQTIALRVRVQNHGTRAYQDIAVHLEADGARLRTTRVSIAPHAETSLTLNHAFDTAGDHALTVRVEGDSFPDDNSFSLVVPVRDQVNTLLIKGTSGSGSLEGATDFLEIALTPHQSAAASLKDVIHTGSVDQKQVREKSFDGAEVIVMANVEKLQGRALNDLEEFVKRGGGLLVFVGPDIDAKWYEQEFFRTGKGLLPCLLKGYGHVDQGQPPARIISQRHTHPATTYFNDSRGMRLQDAAFQHWARCEKIEGEARVLLSLDRGDALLVEKPLVRGRVILCAATANAQWSNLPLQPVFVPLVQRLVTYLATQNASPQFQTCGTSLRVALRKDQ
ncbi:MAG: BatA domain-containing protein, partial [Roseimicrobium sp.]